MSKGDLSYRLRVALSLNNKKPADLCRDLDIPKSAISQYLNGKSKNMSADRLQEIAVYLNVAEAWLMGYDVPMERNKTSEKQYATIEKLDSMAKKSVDDKLLLDEYHKLSDEGKIKARSYVNYLVDEESKEKDTASQDQIGTA